MYTPNEFPEQLALRWGETLDKRFDPTIYTDKELTRATLYHLKEAGHFRDLGYEHLTRWHLRVVVLLLDELDARAAN